MNISNCILYVTYIRCNQYTFYTNDGEGSRSKKMSGDKRTENHDITNLERLGETSNANVHVVMAKH